MGQFLVSGLDSKLTNTRKTRSVWVRWVEPEIDPLLACHIRVAILTRLAFFSTITCKNHFVFKLGHRVATHITDPKQIG